MRKRVRDDRGGVAVIVAVSMIFITGMLALGIDGGRLYSERRSVQNAADHGAYAAAWALCRNLDPVAEGLAAAARNGYDNNGTTSWVTISFVTTNTYRAQVLSKVGTLFSSAIGAKSLNARGEAVARHRCGGAGGASVFGGSTTCQKTVDWPGSTSNIDADVNGDAIHSNNDIHVSGSNNDVVGNSTYVKTGGFTNGGANNTFTPAPKQDVVRPYPGNYQIAHYAPGGSKANLAQSQGQYRYAGNAKIDVGWLILTGNYNATTKVLRDGLYYTTAEVDISDGGILGINGPANVTFVSSSRKIAIQGSNQRLKAWDPDGMLAFTNEDQGCGSPGIAFSGSSSDWEGILYAPLANVNFSGSNNTTLKGNLIGETVTISGQDISIGDGDYGMQPGDVQLLE